MVLGPEAEEVRGAGAGRGSAAHPDVLWLRRFLPEGLGDMRSSSAYGGGHTGVSLEKER